MGKHLALERGPRGRKDACRLWSAALATTSDETTLGASRNRAAREHGHACKSEDNTEAPQPFVGGEKWENLRDDFPSPAWTNKAFPHSQQRRAKHLTLPIPLLYFLNLWRGDDSLGLPDCTLGLCVLGRAQREAGQNGTSCTALWPADAVDRIMWPASRCITLCPTRGVTIHQFESRHWAKWL